MRIFFLFLLFFLQGCSPSTKDEWRLEGISVVRLLIKELEEIDGFIDLEKRQKTIKKKYLSLVDIMIAQDLCSDESLAVLTDTFYSDALQKQYVRLFQLEGCRDMLFSIQKEALHKLDKHVKEHH